MAGDHHGSSNSFSRSSGDFFQSGTRVTATLTLKSGVKREFGEKVSEGGTVPKLSSVREALKAVRADSQDVLNQLVEEERKNISSTQQQNTKGGDGSDYDEEEDDDEDDETMEDDSLDKTEEQLSGNRKGTATKNRARELKSTQPPEKRQKSDDSSENKCVS